MSRAEAYETDGVLTLENGCVRLIFRLYPELCSVGPDGSAKPLALAYFDGCLRLFGAPGKEDFYFTDYLISPEMSCGGADIDGIRAVFYFVCGACPGLIPGVAVTLADGAESAAWEVIIDNETGKDICLKGLDCAPGGIYGAAGILKTGVRSIFGGGERAENG